LHHSGASLHHQSDATSRSGYLPTDPSYAVSVSTASAALQSQVDLNSSYATIDNCFC